MRLLNAAKDNKGSSLIEVLVALALFSAIGVTFLVSLGTVSTVTRSTDERETAKNLAETQLEYIKNQPFAASYSPAGVTGEYAGYIAAVDAAWLQDTNIQKITVVISRNARTLMTLEGYKVR